MKIKSFTGMDDWVLKYPNLIPSKSYFGEQHYVYIFVGFNPGNFSEEYLTVFIDMEGRKGHPVEWEVRKIIDRFRTSFYLDLR